MRALLFALLAVAMLVTSCAEAGKPRSLVPVATADRPLPAGADLTAELPEAGGGEECDATASLKPSSEIPGGSTMAKIRSRGRLIVGVDQNTFLFSFRNPATGKLQGFDVDIAREVAGKLLGDPDKVQFKALTVDERIPALQEGSVDIVVYAMTINCERRKEIEFSSVYFVSGQRVLVRKDSDISGLEDLDGKKACAPAGSTSLVNLARERPKVQLVSVADMGDCLLLLQQRQVDAFSTDDTILAGMAKQDPTTEVVGGTFSSEPYGIGIPKDNPDMVRYVNYVLDEVRKSSWRDIYQRWLEPVLGPADPPRPTYR
jgi:polar amino acid transport system substrate-binding protein